MSPDNPSIGTVHVGNPQSGGKGVSGWKDFLSVLRDVRRGLEDVRKTSSKVAKSQRNDAKSLASSIRNLRKELKALQQTSAAVQKTTKGVLSAAPAGGHTERFFQKALKKQRQREIRKNAQEIAGRHRKGALRSFLKTEDVYGAKQTPVSRKTAIKSAIHNYKIFRKTVADARKAVFKLHKIEKHTPFNKAAKMGKQIEKYQAAIRKMKKDPAAKEAGLLPGAKPPSFLKFALGAGLRKAGQAISSVFKRIGSAAKTVGKSIKSVFTGVSNFLQNSGKIGQAVVKVFSKLGQGIVSVAKYAGMAFKSIGSLVASLVSLGPAGLVAAGALTAVVAVPILAHFTELSKVGATVASVFTNIGTSLKLASAPLLGYYVLTGKLGKALGNLSNSLLSVTKQLVQFTATAREEFLRFQALMGARFGTNMVKTMMDTLVGTAARIGMPLNEAIEYFTFMTNNPDIRKKMATPRAGRANKGMIDRSLSMLQVISLTQPDIKRRIGMMLPNILSGDRRSFAFGFEISPRKALETIRDVFTQRLEQSEDPKRIRELQETIASLPKNIKEAYGPNLDAAQNLKFVQLYTRTLLTPQMQKQLAMRIPIQMQVVRGSLQRILANISGYRVGDSKESFGAYDTIAEAFGEIKEFVLTIAKWGDFRQIRESLNSIAEDFVASARKYITGLFEGLDKEKTLEDKIFKFIDNFISASKESLSEAWDTVAKDFGNKLKEVFPSLTPQITSAQEFFAILKESIKFTKNALVDIYKMLPGIFRSIMEFFSSVPFSPLETPNERLSRQLKEGTAPERAQQAWDKFIASGNDPSEDVPDINAEDKGSSYGSRLRNTFEFAKYWNEKEKIRDKNMFQNFVSNIEGSADNLQDIKNKYKKEREKDKEEREKDKEEREKDKEEKGSSDSRSKPFRYKTEDIPANIRKTMTGIPLNQREQFSKMLWELLSYYASGRDNTKQSNKISNMAKSLLGESLTPSETLGRITNITSESDYNILKKQVGGEDKLLEGIWRSFVSLQKGNVPYIPGNDAARNIGRLPRLGLRNFVPQNVAPMEMLLSGFDNRGAQLFSKTAQKEVRLQLDFQDIEVNVKDDRIKQSRKRIRPRVKHEGPKRGKHLSEEDLLRGKTPEYPTAIPGYTNTESPEYLKQVNEYTSFYAKKALDENEKWKK